MLFTDWWSYSFRVGPRCVFKLLFVPLQRREVMLPENKLILSSASVASPLRRTKDCVGHRDAELWRAIMRSEQSHLCLIFLALWKWQIPQGQRGGSVIWWLFIFILYIPCFLLSIEPFRLEIPTSGLINTINYCWLMKTYGHGWLAVFRSSKGRVPSAGAQKLLFAAGIWLVRVIAL